MNTAGSVLSGNLDFIHLGDLLQLLGTGGSSGILRLSSKYVPDSGLVYFEQGNPINAANGSLSGLDALYSLFGWTEGRFDFSEENFSQDKVINKGRMEIILDGLRMLDDGQIEILGPFSSDAQEADAVSEKNLTVPLIRGPLVDYMYVVAEEEFFNGENIIEEGNHGSWIWVILEGVVEVQKKSSGGMKTLCKIADGGFVGSIASFLVRDSIRNTTTKALGNVQLGVMDCKRLTREFAEMPIDLRALVLGLDKRLQEITDRIDANKNKPYPLEIFVQQKKLVLKQGSASEKIFKIQQGMAYVAKVDHNTAVPLVTLQPGDFFGNIPFLKTGHEPYSATVFGSEDLKVSKIDPNRLTVEYNQLTTTFKNIVEHICTLISVATMMVAKTGNSV